MIRRESRHHVRRRENGSSIYGENERRRSKRVKVNINFVSRGGPDRARRLSARGIDGKFPGSDLYITITSN